MTKINPAEIKAIIDSGKNLSQDNHSLQSVLKQVQAFGNESQHKGKTWEAAKNLANQAIVSLIKGTIAYNDALIVGNAKLNSALSNYHYGELDSNQVQSTIDSLNEMIKQTQYDYQTWNNSEFKRNPITAPMVTIYCNSLRDQITNDQQLVKEFAKQLQAIQNFKTAVNGAYNEAEAIKKSLNKAVKALGQGGSNTYKNGDFLLTDTSWAKDLNTEYDSEQSKAQQIENAEILNTLNTKGMNASQIKEYKARILIELDFLDTKGWDKNGKKDYVSYINAEYDNYQKDALIHLNSFADWLGPNQEGDALIRGIHDIIANPLAFTYSEIDYKADDRFPTNGDIIGKSQFYMMDKYGNRYSPAFLSFFGKDIPDINWSMTTYTVRPMAGAGADYNARDPHFYYLYDENGKYDDSATETLSLAESKIQSDFFVSSAIEKLKGQIAAEGTVQALFIAAALAQPEIGVGEAVGDGTISEGFIFDLTESSIARATEEGLLTSAQVSRLKTAENTISHNLKESDFSGTLRDLKGDPVPNSTGGYFDHEQEMRNSYQSLSNSKKGINDMLKNPNLNAETRRILETSSLKINSYMSRIEQLFAPYGGIK
ncbi:MAG: polymorphic toxin type 28 domain-containing protein [Streptococcaceae bacterium]|nr:polymorphic toxin type 28 domain-containing protein [Streptococcaceae bacterium]MCL2681140.1 polymorphic toxin type 28 domain-containing protein [Streptococcaceae bacterium]MCL2858706.1 polymorphic toxin type 28 domain-containing protein [Streptococcaceae bacterium]